MSNITLLDSVFNLSSHNGIQCIEKTDATRPCDCKWFTEKQLSLWSGLPHTTLWRKINLLKEKGRVIFNTSSSKMNNTDAATISLMYEDGTPREIQIYNLNVLNQLAMICIESDSLNEVSKKFSDILSEVETTGSYAIQKKSPKQEKEEKENELILLTVKSSSAEDRMIALGTLKDLWTETANKRAFSAMGTASAKSKENTKLKAENEDLKVRLQESTNYICVKAIPWLTKYFIITKEKDSDSVYSAIGKKLTALSKKLNYEIKNVPDPRWNGGVNSYHIDVVEAFRKQLDNDSSILEKYRK